MLLLKTWTPLNHQAHRKPRATQPIMSIPLTTTSLPTSPRESTMLSFWTLLQTLILIYLSMSCQSLLQPPNLLLVLGLHLLLLILMDLYLKAVPLHLPSTQFFLLLQSVWLYYFNLCFHYSIFGASLLIFKLQFFPSLTKSNFE